MPLEIEEKLRWPDRRLARSLAASDTLEMAVLRALTVAPRRSGSAASAPTGFCLPQLLRLRWWPAVGRVDICAHMCTNVSESFEGIFLSTCMHAIEAEIRL